MSYISSFNLLNSDSPININGETLQDELALWANAQFNFDTIPGTALKEDVNKGKDDQELIQTLTELSQLVQHQNNTTVPPHEQQTDKVLGCFPIQFPSSTNNAASLPRIAPAPGPFSSVQLMEIHQALYTNNNYKQQKRSENESSAEEDKRRRNTAASARFRMKKKLREQALERTTKEMEENVEILEAKVKELEMEAKWLRNLILEKDPNLLNQIEENSNKEDASTSKK
ncbi:uncharacterized protein BX663DRAFT_510428 [Cokeromyces recurvatus]|uniref:uncharacterized protein n=1 Tax=Cokeromyces recurvatus TaxID=90255 RepID=UPI00221FFA10|nr:uncharacterized protein BX663DRAFT_510428 [Cokeromyces recurvatus]KAI7902770.1 hypothetical protein BX663DRAFT_510428 [Cokeromyces recurvatus]